MLRSEALYTFADKRQSVRDFSDQPVPIELMKNLIRTTGIAPSGAHKPAGAFFLAGNPETKAEIRKAAEKEEYENYHPPMSGQWLKDLAPLDTGWNKPFLEIVPWLIVVFKRVFEYVNGEKWQNYYVNESAGIACRMLINAIHHAGLATLTHTPSPMKFLSDILKRPDNERPYMLLPVGYPTKNALIPDLHRKNIDEICIIID